MDYSYSRFENDDVIVNYLNNSNNVSGLPIKNINGKMYYNNNGKSNIIIGTDNSSTTDSLILPGLKQTINYNESFIIYCDNKTVYNNLIDELNNSNYDVILCDNEFENIYDIKQLKTSKTALFIIDENNTLNNEFSKFISSIENYEKTQENEKQLNIIIYNFNKLPLINDFSNIIINSNDNKIVFTIIINGYNDLINLYGVEEGQLIKGNIQNVYYLLTSELDTLDEISKICGPKNENDLLVSISDLQSLKEYEAIILIPRLYPIKSNLKQL